MALLRASMTRQRYTTAAQVATIRNGQRLRIAGLILVRQRPGSAKGVCLITLEDETGVANLVVWPKVMAAFRKVVMTAQLVQVTGRIQRDPVFGVTHVVVDTLTDRSDALLRLSDHAFAPQMSRGDEVGIPSAPRVQTIPATSQ